MNVAAEKRPMDSTIVNKMLFEEKLHLKKINRAT